MCFCCIILIGARSTHHSSSTFCKLAMVHTSTQLKRQAVLFVMCHAVEWYSLCVMICKDRILRAPSSRHRGQVQYFCNMDLFNLESSLHNLSWLSRIYAHEIIEIGMPKFMYEYMQFLFNSDL